MKMATRLFSLYILGLLAASLQSSCSGFAVAPATRSSAGAPTVLSASANANDPNNSPDQQQERRRVLQTLLSTTTLAAFTAAVPQSAQAVAQRAVGGAEVDCRAAGNCMELGQLDGAVGWNWGAKDRCDAADPRCGVDGRLGELPAGKPVPEVIAKITHVAEIIIDIGREETGVLHIGLYGEACPGSVKQMLKFLTEGLSTTSALAFENGMGIKSSPVSLLQGGKIPDIVPGKVVDFGVPSQALAYSRARGLRNAGDEFVPQARPNPQDTQDDPFLRKHDIAGLVSVPAKGIGYGGNGFEPEDEAYDSAFLVTADALTSLDKNNGRRVIGQVIDEPSMAFLARLSSLPTKKGIKGVIPGQTSGPPLLKVTIRDVDVKKVQT